MAMTVSEARSEIKALYSRADLIERRYPDGEITRHEDLEEVKTLLNQIDSLEEKLAVLEDTEQRRNRIMGGIDRYSAPARGGGGQYSNPNVQEILEGKTIDPGTQFVTSREYRELKNSGAFNSSLNRVQFGVQLKDGTSLLEWKALISATGAGGAGGFVANDVRPGLIDLRYRDLTLMDLIPRSPTGSDTIEYVREDTFTNNAAFVAEATATTGTTGTKPESALAYSTATSTVRTLAHWIPVTNRMLDDAPAIRGMINGRLLQGLQLALETQVISGDGNGDNFLGLVNTPGVLIQGGTESILDRMFMARTQVRVTGKGTPTAYVINPLDWQAIRLARQNAATGTLGDYLMGAPNVTGPVTVWGIPVVESEGVPENTILVGDFNQGLTLFDREQAAVRVGTIGDQFIRNMQTILAELRAAFVVWRPAMFSRITGA